MKRILVYTLIMGLLFVGCSTSPSSGGTSENTAAGTEKAAAGNETSADSAQKNASEGQKNADEVEAEYFPTSNHDYKTAYNERYDFWFDIPASWKAVDKSSNGDGYFIITDNKDVDVRVYGIMKTSTDDEFYNKLSGENGMIADISFNDGKTGKKIESTDSQVYFVKVDGDSYICFYINHKKDSAWYKMNMEQLNYAAMSLRTHKESAANEAVKKNKITMDDLKLGDINLDMSYDNVVKIMKAKLLKEEDDDIGGKTMFYEDGTEIYLVDGAVYSVNVIKNNYATTRGLKVGNDSTRIKELYGEPDNINDETHWGYTYEGYELFSIVLKDGKVVEMQIDMMI